MMISPECFIERYMHKTYIELLVVREELLAEIREFERHDLDANEIIIDPSPEVVYQCNLKYLGKLCELISEKYNQQYIWGDNEEFSYLEIIQYFLESKGLKYDSTLKYEIEKRKNGKRYSIQAHIKGMIYSLLSNQTKWSRLEPHLSEIDALFYYYDPDRILLTEPRYFYEALFRMKCGNIKTVQQMESLADNVLKLQWIERQYGSIDTFITSDIPDEIVKKLSSSSSPYKILLFGEALAWEYLRNVGIDGAKPDTHLRRFLGADRMGTGKNSPATINEVYEQVESLSEQTGLLKVEIDNLIWSFCADGYGEICTATPKCTKCPIKGFCKYCY